MIFSKSAVAQKKVQRPFISVAKKNKAATYTQKQRENNEKMHNKGQIKGKRLFFSLFSKNKNRL